MTPTSRLPLYVSVSFIVIYWIYKLVDLDLHPEIPETFSQLVLKITGVKIAVTAAIFGLLAYQKQGLDSVGLTRREWNGHILRGLLFGTAMFIFFNVGLSSVLNSIFPKGPDSGAGIMKFFTDPTNIIAWMLIGMIGGGFVEELERVFVLTRFEQWLGKGGLVAAVILTSVFFGMGHLYQGVGNAVSIALSGLCFSLIYLSRRSGWEAVIAHAFSDVLAIAVAFFLADR